MTKLKFHICPHQNIIAWKILIYKDILKIPKWYYIKPTNLNTFSFHCQFCSTFAQLELGHLIRCVRHFRNFKTSRNNSLDICSFLRYSHLCLNTHFNPNKCITVNALSDLKLEIPNIMLVCKFEIN
jgi:hypothetical protein